MSPMFWQDQLKIRLDQIPRDNHQPRIALVGVGNTLRGDDGVGVLLVRELNQVFGEASNVCIIEAGSAPENITGHLRNFKPDFILFFDAAQMEGEPGEVGIWSFSECGGDLVSTHALPLSLVCAYLEVELNCRIALMGIKPLDIGFGRSISLQVEQALNEIAPSIVSILSEAIGMQVHTSKESSKFMFEDRLKM